MGIEQGMTLQEYQSLMEVSQRYNDEFYEKRRKRLEVRSIYDLKALRHKVRDKKWEIYEEMPFSENISEAIHRLALFDIVIGQVIANKRGDYHE